ncbi:MAG: hypothetical protein QNK26_07855 [Moritella sp.]|nr:hypothetical protein [Moritella sp.]MDX2320498.1 hypothetical protein [Moritella sp.]
MNVLQERAKDFIDIAAAQDTVNDNRDVVEYLMMLLFEVEEKNKQRQHR